MPQGELTKGYYNSSDTDSWCAKQDWDGEPYFTEGEWRGVTREYGYSGVVMGHG